MFYELIMPEVKLPRTRSLFRSGLLRHSKVVIIARQTAALDAGGAVGRGLRERGPGRPGGAPGPGAGRGPAAARGTTPAEDGADHPAGPWQVPGFGTGPIPAGYAGRNHLTVPPATPAPDPNPEAVPPPGQTRPHVRTALRTRGLRAQHSLRERRPDLLVQHGS
jgi:hypothetical protein